MRKDNMRKAIKKDDLRPNYDFSESVRGKHYKAYREGTNLVLLDPYISELCKDLESVNHALRMLLELAGKEVKRNMTES